MGRDTETVNLKAVLAQSQADAAYLKKSLVEMELERDRLRIDNQAVRALNEKLAADIDKAGDRAMEHASQIADLISARRRDGQELHRLRTRVREAEAAVEFTVSQCDEAVFGLAESAERTIRDLTKMLAKPCPSCPCAIHRTQIVNGYKALDELNKAKS